MRNSSARQRLHAPLSAEADRRVAPRYRVRLAVDLRTLDGVSLSNELTNLSRSGFRTRCAVALPRGAVVVIRIAGHGARRARVAWQIGEEIGCRFANPLAPDILAALFERQSGI